MPSVTCKPHLLNVFMLSVVMLNVVMLNVANAASVIYAECHM